MNAHQKKVIESLYNSPNLNKLLAKIKSKDKREEVKQQLFLTLCHMRYKEFKAICTRQPAGIERYACLAVRNLGRRTVENEVREEKRKANYVRHQQQQTAFPELANDHQRLAVKFLNELPEYNQKIMELYIDNGYSSLKVSKAVGISARSVRHTLSITRQYIVDKIKKHDR
jgi:DNA-directed RNA polymerase specialized sigma24 family protein